jgi:hypothetical protein
MLPGLPSFGQKLSLETNVRLHSLRIIFQIKKSLKSTWPKLLPKAKTKNWSLRKNADVAPSSRKRKHKSSKNVSANNVTSRPQNAKNFQKQSILPRRKLRSGIRTTGTNTNDNERKLQLWTDYSSFQRQFELIHYLCPSIDTILAVLWDTGETWLHITERINCHQDNRHTVVRLIKGCFAITVLRHKWYTIETHADYGRDVDYSHAP